MTLEKKTLSILGAILLSVLLFTFFRIYYLKHKQVEEYKEDLQTMQTESFSALETLEGEPFFIDVKDEKVKVVEHWASWCITCQGDLNQLSALAKEYISEPVSFYAINRKEPRSTIMSYLKEFFPTGIENIEVIIDINDTHFIAVGGYTMPETIVYNQTGEVVLHIHGPISTLKLQQVLDGLFVQELH